MRGRVREYRKVAETATPKALLNKLPVAKRAATSPPPSTANNTTADHQAHLLRSKRPVAAAAVPRPSTNSSTPEIRPSIWNTADAGLFRSHNRSKRLLGNIGDVPTTAAVAVATNRKVATIGTVFGLGCVSVTTQFASIVEFPGIPAGLQSLSRSRRGSGPVNVPRKR
jgi:hypothetical protein